MYIDKKKKNETLWHFSTKRLSGIGGREGKTHKRIARSRNQWQGRKNQESVTSSKPREKKNISTRKDALTLPNAAGMLGEMSPGNWPYVHLAA